MVNNLCKILLYLLNPIVMLCFALFIVLFMTCKILWLYNADKMFHMY